MINEREQIRELQRLMDSQAEQGYSEESEEEMDIDFFVQSLLKRK